MHAQCAVNRQDGIKQRPRAFACGRNVGIDYPGDWVIDGVHWFAGTRPAVSAQSSPPRAIAPAHLPLLSQLLADFLPVKDSIRAQPPHIPLVLSINRVVVDAHDMKVLPADFDCEVANSLLGRDEGGGLLIC